MKILIDLTCMSSSMSGVRRYASCISEELLKIDNNNEYILLFHNDIYSSFIPYIDNKRITTKTICCNNNILFKLILLPLVLYKTKADKYLFLYSKGPLFFYNKNIYNTIHDLVCWDYPKTMNFFQMIHSRLLNRQASIFSKKIITVSNFTKERIIKILKYPKNNILVTYEGISNSLNKNNGINYEKIKEKYNLPNSYIMTLSTLEPRKNLNLLLEAFNNVHTQVDYDLVLVGERGWKIDQLFKNLNNPKIHLTGYVNDEEVIEIYKHAKCFVFPSLYEGFGLPPLEALSLNTPVLSSDGGSLPEVLRNQARYFKNNDLKALENELLNLNTNIDSMPKSLDEFQIKNYNFNSAAKKLYILLNSD